VRRRSGPVAELLAVFARLSLTAFGGPAGHVAVFREELVRRRAWLDDAEFLDLVALTSLLPGPNSTELAMELGRRRAGHRGLVAAGLGFIGPAALVVLAVAAAYVAFGGVPPVAAAFAGVMPVVIGLLLVTVASLARTLAGRPILLLAGAVCALGALAGVDELALLAAGAVAGALLGPPRARRGQLARGASGGAALLAGAGALAAVPVTGAAGLATLLGVFLKTGALLFGSGYVLVAFLRADLVDRLGWLSERELLDAIAVGQVTPGPLFTTATFVGYVLAGLPGAVVATVGIFLPAFGLVAVLGPMLPGIAARPPIRALLDGVRAASVGLIAAVTVSLGVATILPSGRLDAIALAAAAASVVALASRRVGTTVLVAAGALLGLARLLAGV